MIDARTRLNAIDSLAGEIKRRGVGHYWIEYSSAERGRFVYRDGALEESQSALTAELKVGLYRDGRYAVQRTTDVREAAFGPFLDAAVGFLADLPADPAREPVPPELQGCSPGDLEQYDAAIPSTSPEARIGSVREMWEASKAADGRIADAMAFRTESAGETTKAWSGGFVRSASRTLLSLYSVVTVLAPDGSRPTESYGTVGRRLRSAENPRRIGLVAAERAISRIGQERAPTGTYDVVVDAECADSVIEPLFQALRGWTMHLSGSFLDGKIDALVSAPLLSIADDPGIPGALGSRASDEDGIPAVRRSVIDSGILRSYYVDWYISRKRNMRLTSGSASNLRVEPAVGVRPETRASLIAGTEKGLLVTGFNGGNSNSLTGDFSLGVSGYLIAGGQIGRPFNEMVMSGNFGDLLRTLDGIGDDPWPCSEFLVPTLRFRDVVVAGL